MVIKWIFKNIKKIEKDELYVWGSNEYGQLGLNDTTNRNKLECINSLKGKKINQIECGGWHSIALTGNFKIWNI